MPQPLSVQTVMGVVRRSEISKLRNKGVIVKVVGKVSTVLHDFRLQQNFCSTEQNHQARHVSEFFFSNQLFHIQQIHISILEQCRLFG